MQLYMQAFTPRMAFIHCVHRLWELTWHAGYMSSTGRAGCTGCNFTTANCLRAVSVICIMLLRASPAVSPSFDFSQFQNEASILWFYTATQGACFVSNVSLLSPSLAFILVFSTLLLALIPHRSCTCMTPCIAIWSTLGTATVIC